MSHMVSIDVLPDLYRRLMVSTKQRRPASELELVPFSFLVSWPVEALVTVAVEPDGRIVRLTCAVPGCAPKVNSTVSLYPVTYGLLRPSSP
jgi:hypothetical protein